MQWRFYIHYTFNVPISMKYVQTFYWTCSLKFCQPPDHLVSSPSVFFCLFTESWDCYDLMPILPCFRMTFALTGFPLFSIKQIPTLKKKSIILSLSTLLRLCWAQQFPSSFQIFFAYILACFSPPHLPKHPYPLLPLKKKEIFLLFPKQISQI